MLFVMVVVGQILNVFVAGVGVRLSEPILKPANVLKIMTPLMANACVLKIVNCRKASAVRRGSMPIMVFVVQKMNTIQKVFVVLTIC